MEQERTPRMTKRARTAPPPPPRAHQSPAPDRLSALDDATLHAILALLPLRDAAATSALSRRWPRVFATLPRLTLRPATFNRRGFADGGDEDYCEDADRWMHSLACVLGSRAAPVPAFEVRYKYMGLHDRWFHALFRALCGSGGLRELCVTNTKYREFYPVPPPIYTCDTLTALDLCNWRLKVPPKIAGLRAVSSLQLRWVVASNADLRRIIARCTAVEHLEIVEVHRARNVVIRAPNLVKLEIYTHRPLRISVKKAPRLDTVRLSLSYSYPQYSWSIHDSMDSDQDYAYSEIEEMCDYEKMAEREHQQTDEVGNMVTFLGGLGCAKKLRISLPTQYSQVRNVANVSIPKRLNKKSFLHGLETLTVFLDHNNEVHATLVSCLLNSSPTLKDLRIRVSPKQLMFIKLCFASSCSILKRFSCLSYHEYRCYASPTPLAPEFWEKQINADCVLNHLSSFTFFIESPFEGHPCGGLCRLMVMNARVLKRMRIQYLRSEVKPEHATNLEAVRNELNLCPRASPDVLVELSPLAHYPSY